MSEPSGLSPRQTAAVWHVLACPTLGSAAGLCSVASSTLHRWIGLPAFQTALAQQQGQLVEHSVHRLQKAMVHAATVLHSMLDAPALAPGIRVQVCRSILEYGFRGTELLELGARLRALEEAQRAQEDTTR